MSKTRTIVLIAAGLVSLWTFIGWQMAVSGDEASVRDGYRYGWTYMVHRDGCRAAFIHEDKMYGTNHSEGMWVAGCWEAVDTKFGR